MLFITFALFAFSFSAAEESSCPVGERSEACNNAPNQEAVDDDHVALMQGHSILQHYHKEETSQKVKQEIEKIKRDFEMVATEYEGLQEQLAEQHNAMLDDEMREELKERVSQRLLLTKADQSRSEEDLGKDLDEALSEKTHQCSGTACGTLKWEQELSAHQHHQYRQKQCGSSYKLKESKGFTGIASDIDGHC